MKNKKRILGVIKENDSFLISVLRLTSSRRSIRAGFTSLSSNLRENLCFFSPISDLTQVTLKKIRKKRNNSNFVDRFRTFLVCRLDSSPRYRLTCYSWQRIYIVDSRSQKIKSHPKRRSSLCPFVDFRFSFFRLGRLGIILRNTFRAQSLILIAFLS